MIPLNDSVVTQLRNQSPLILNITNLVTMDFIANGLLSLGASPIMSESIEELDELLTMAHALVINMGTLSPSWVSLASQAAEKATQLKRPIIFDPVGAGASKYRTQTARYFLNQYPLSIVRGNASELLALTDSSSVTKGVDSQHDAISAPSSFMALGRIYPNTVFAISGATDVIVHQDQLTTIEGGSSWMPKITGSGCLLTALTAAFHGCEPDALTASIAAMRFYKRCAEHAELNAQGPGTFKSHLLDALAILN